MVVYADVLIVLNLFVNFFLLKLTARLGREGARTGRMILGAFIGALFSLSIFLPPIGAWLESLFHLCLSAVIVLVTFGFDRPRCFARRIAVFFVASFLYAGCMMGVWAVSRSERVAIQNGMVYVDISPTVLLVTTGLCYLILSLLRFIGKKQAFHGKRCRLIFTLNQREVRVTALVDTGHSLTDQFTDKPVVIVEQSVAEQLLQTTLTKEIVATDGKPISGFRVIPYSAVGGHGLLPAFSPDKAEWEERGERRSLEPLLLAVSEEPLGQDYRAIVSPELFSSSP